VGAGGLDLGGADVVGLLQEVQTLGGDFAGEAGGEARAEA
jgi:hypothetical protein